MKLAGLKTVADAHGESIWAVTWVPATESRAPLLISGSLDETVKIWRGDELEEQRTSPGHSLGVVAVAAHPAGRLAASTSLDSCVRVFDVDSNAIVSTLEAPTSEAWSMQFDPKGEALAVAGGASNSVRLWNTSTWRKEFFLAVPRGEGVSGKSTDRSGPGFVMAVAWSLDGRHLACSTNDGLIAVFDTVHGRFLHFLEGHYMPVRSLAFSPVDSRVLFTASDDMHIHVYDADNNSFICAMSGHTNWVLSVDVSPDGCAIATGSSDRTVRLWDLSMRSSIQTMTCHTDQVWGVAFRPSGGQGDTAGRLVSVSADKSISLYDYS